MKPQEIPPILQQILHFCLSGDFLTLFCTLQKYFDDKYHLDQSNDENFGFEIGMMFYYQLSIHIVNQFVSSSKYLHLILNWIFRRC